MKTNRIIFVDQQDSFVFPLQLKFLEEIEEKAEYEIITDYTYFQRIFQVNQNIDVLVISESFYSEELSFHNIKHLIILLEDEANAYKYPQYVCFNKYTDVNHLYRGIYAIIKSNLNGNENESDETKIIGVYSSKGGVGKTILSLSLCEQLVHNQKNVLYIDASQNQIGSIYFKDKTSILNENVYSNILSKHETAYGSVKNQIKHEQFYYLPPFKSSLNSMGMDQYFYVELLKELKKLKMYHYIIVDMDNDFSKEKEQLFLVIDKILYLVDQSDAGVYAANKMIENITNEASEKFCCILNHYSSEKQINITPYFNIEERIPYIQEVSETNLSEFQKNESIQRLIYVVL